MRWASTHWVGSILLVLWTVWLGMSLWAAPVHASGAALRTAAEQGQITNVTRVGSPPPTLSGDPMFLFRRDDAADRGGAFLVWTDSAGHRYSTDAATVPGPFPDDGVITSGTMFSGDGSHPTAGDRVTAYIVGRTHFQGGIIWLGVMQMVLLLFAIGALCARTPRRGTRWFWFWVLNLPLGLGVLGFAISEWLREPGALRQRWNGGQGLAVTLVGGFALPLVVGASQQLFARL